MSWSTLDSQLERIKRGDSPKLTVILGAGIHCMNPEGNNPLSSWSGLLNSVSNDMGYPLVGDSPSMEWELISMASKDGNQMAHEGERNFRKNLRDKIRDLESDAIRHGREFMEPLFEILDAGVVSDVVSLNLDLVLERLYAERHGRTLKVQGKDRLSRFREIKSDSGNGVRFWHPHGDIGSVETMLMGMWEYQKQLPKLRSKFNHFKSKERQSKRKGFYFRVNRTAESWFELMMFRPLIFAGTSLHLAEWDLWYSLLLRWRNRSRSEDSFGQTWRLEVEAPNSSCPDGGTKVQAISPLIAPDWPTAWSRLVQTTQE
jgi:hypothetical protein